HRRQPAPDGAPGATRTTTWHPISGSTNGRARPRDDRSAPRPAEPPLGARAGRLRAGQLHQDPGLPPRAQPLSAAGTWVGPGRRRSREAVALRPHRDGAQCLENAALIERVSRTSVHVCRAGTWLAKRPPTGWRGRQRRGRPASRGPEHLASAGDREDKAAAVWETSCVPPARLLGGSPSHLVFGGGEGAQNRPL